jgi:hypothetical protein
MIIFVTKESPLSTASPLGDVARDTTYNNSASRSIAAGYQSHFSLATAPLAGTFADPHGEPQHRAELSERIYARSTCLSLYSMFLKRKSRRSQAVKAKGTEIGALCARPSAGHQLGPVVQRGERNQEPLLIYKEKNGSHTTRILKIFQLFQYEHGRTCPPAQRNWITSGRATVVNGSSARLRHRYPRRRQTSLIAVGSRYRAKLPPT